MTTEVDAAAVSRNLALLSQLVELVSGPTTNFNVGSKVVVTSRGRFFDQPREEAVLKERLGNPAVRRIRPLTRTEVLASLTSHARHIGAESKLTRIKRLYDPIGLAAKPLFLQMIKETLSVLPDDSFDALGLYETYIEQSLSRKAELLRERAGLALDIELRTQLRVILERVAWAQHVARSLRPCGG